MNEQPSMAHLPIPDEVPEGFDLLDAQRKLQFRAAQVGKSPRTPNPDFRDETEAQVLERVRMNWEADQSEIQEIMDRLPWKDWKLGHLERRESGKLLSSEDRFEIQMELIDRLHFLMNMLIGLGFETWDEVERFYIAKNQENFDRIARGY